MAKLAFHLGMLKIEGRLGGRIVRGLPDDEMELLKAREQPERKSSPAQMKYRERFKQATAYATAALADPYLRGVYEKMAAEKHISPRSMAISDYYKGNDLLSKE